MIEVRTVQRGYSSRTGRTAGQVRRVHVVREEGPRGWEGDSKQTMCGQHAWDVTDSPSLIRPAPVEPADGLTWCPKCVGHLAEKLGRLQEVAQLIGLEPRRV